MEKRDVRILIIDDEKANRDLLCRFFTLKDVVCASAGSGEEALAMAGENPFHLVFLDINLAGGENGFAVKNLLKGKLPGCRYVMMTGYSSEDYPDAGKDPDIISFLEKPFNFSSVMAAVEKVLALP